VDLSIIIVNWNSFDFTKQCIQSLSGSVGTIEYEVIVVDNASHRDEAAAIADLFPTVKVLASEQNVGFSWANNLGFECCEGANILFLNPDTVTRGDVIDKMVGTLNRCKDFGVIGCTILNSDESIQTSCIQAFPTVSNQLLGIDCLKARWPSLPIFGIRQLFVAASDPVIEVDVVSGACLMIRREVFERVGKFSTDYFMYAEEADLCYKVRQAGWRVGFLPGVNIIHFGGQSTNKRESGFSDVMMRESLFTFFRKFYGMPYALLYRLGQLMSGMVRIAIMAPLFLIPKFRAKASRVIRKWSRITGWSITLRNSAMCRS